MISPALCERSGEPKDGRLFVTLPAVDRPAGLRVAVDRGRGVFRRLRVARRRLLDRHRLPSGRQLDLAQEEIAERPFIEHPSGPAIRQSIVGKRLETDRRDPLEPRAELHGVDIALALVAAGKH